MNSQYSALKRSPLRPAEKMLYAGIIIAGILYAIRYFIDVFVIASDVALTTLNASPWRNYLKLHHPLSATCQVASSFLRWSNTSCASCPGIDCELLVFLA